MEDNLLFLNKNRFVYKTKFPSGSYFLVQKNEKGDVLSDPNFIDGELFYNCREDVGCFFTKDFLVITSKEKYFEIKLKLKKILFASLVISPSLNYLIVNFTGLGEYEKTNYIYFDLVKEKVSLIPDSSIVANELNGFYNDDILIFSDPKFCFYKKDVIYCKGDTEEFKVNIEKFNDTLVRIGLVGRPYGALAKRKEDGTFIYSYFVKEFNISRSKIKVILNKVFLNGKTFIDLGTRERKVFPSKYHLYIYPCFSEGGFQKILISHSISKIKKDTKERKILAFYDFMDSDYSLELFQTNYELKFCYCRFI